MEHPPSAPTDFWFPPEAKDWTDRQRDLYIERVCIWSDGKPIPRATYLKAAASVKNEL